MAGECRGSLRPSSDDNEAAELDPHFQGFASFVTDRGGRYRYTTIKPGPYPDGDSSPRPPHIHHDVAGSRNRIITEMIFPGEPLNETDDVLAGTDRSRLTARDDGRGADGVQRYLWDIVLMNG